MVENQGVATVTVTRAGGSTGAVSGNYATSDGTATAGSDYTATSGTLTFADGETTKTFTIPIINDTLVENDETLTLTLSNPTGGATLGSQATATLTIVDNDVAANAPTTGAHVLAFTHFGAPAGTLSTAPIVTQTAGSTVLAWVGRGGISTFTPATAPQDNLGSTAVQLGTTHNYAPHSSNSGMALYGFQPFAGGGNATFSVPMPVNDEVTLSVVEVKNGGLIQDVQWNSVVNAPQTSLSVTTTGPATLVAFWTGDGATGAVSAVPDGGFTVLDTELASSDAVQMSVATKDVSAAGTYTVTWTVNPAQIAYLWLVAVQHGTPTPPPSPPPPAPPPAVGRFTTVNAASGGDAIVSQMYQQNPDWWLSGEHLVDLDNDGVLDLFLDAHTGGSVAALNDGHGHFAARPSAIRGVDPATLDYAAWGTAVVTDFDNDGTADIIMDGKYYLKVLRGVGGGDFVYMNTPGASPIRPHRRWTTA